MADINDKAREICEAARTSNLPWTEAFAVHLLRHVEERIAAVEMRAGSDDTASEPAAPRDWSNEEVEACARAARQSNSALREMVGMPVNKATMDDVRAVLAGERSVDPEWDRAVLSHAATLRPPAAVPSPTTQRHTGPGHFTSPRGEVASDCGYCMGEAPAAVPASPQAETRGDLLERMAGALDDAAIRAEAGVVPLPAMAARWRAILAEYDAAKEQP